MLGIPPEQERLYVTLVAHPDSSLAELAELAELTDASGAPLRTVAAQLDELAASGMVVAEEGDPSARNPAPTFRAASPSVALTPLLLRRRTMLDRTEAAVLALAEQYRHVASPAAGGVVEVLHGAGATRQRFAQLLGGARQEVLVFPTEVAVAVDQESADPMVEDVLRRGVAVRTVISRHHLQADGTMAAARQSSDAGVQVRVAEDVPVRMLVCDRANALMSLSQEDGSNEADSLVIHGTALVQALALLFEQYWRRAHRLPLDAEPGHAGEPGAAGPTGEDRLILSLLALGLSDRKIAAQLDISLRTVERRLRSLMELAGAQSRFQLGLYAARHGWLPTDEDGAAGVTVPASIGGPPPRR
ncbi:LuxR C-terminal-related transcriptional regulator [Streptomyces sp. NPDC057717]|uniref:LuxR C-terminal-related transcriptional regulator n=1 Tax=unclassified Streptomyces TaxID=2593676 RepID=UPI0036337C87